jgi:hypothetical protein
MESGSLNSWTRQAASAQLGWEKSNGTEQAERDTGGRGADLDRGPRVVAAGTAATARGGSQYVCDSHGGQKERWVQRRQKSKRSRPGRKPAVSTTSTARSNCAPTR